MPQLGPPLPGDLGRPMLARAGASIAGHAGAPPIAEQQRRHQEIEAARTSRLFAPTTSDAQCHSRCDGVTAGDADRSDRASCRRRVCPERQDRKLAFVNASVDRRTTSADRLAAPASPYVVQAGTVIPAALITGIRSDLPGQITAQVTENVYDTPTGTHPVSSRRARA